MFYDIIRKESFWCGKSIAVETWKETISANFQTLSVKKDLWNKFKAYLKGCFMQLWIHDCTLLCIAKYKSKLLLN